MRTFKINKRMQYDTVYEPGQVIDHLPEADTENLRLGGFGDYVEGESDAPIVPPVAHGKDSGITGGEGPDDPLAPAADPEPKALTCEACDGREFGSAAALATHNRAKHA